MNGCPPGLALMERLKATRKWAIEKDYHMGRGCVLSPHGLLLIDTSNYLTAVKVLYKTVSFFILCLCFLFCFLNPSLDPQHISVHAISSHQSTPSTPADHAHQIPFSISVTDQRSSAITSAGVNTTSGVTCAAHAFCDAIPKTS